MSADKAFALFGLGVVSTLAAVQTWRAVDRRLTRLEMRPAPPSTIGVPDSTLDERMAEIRRQSARDFASALKEEGLVIKEAAA